MILTVSFEEPMFCFLFFTFILAIFAQTSEGVKPMPGQAEASKIRVQLGQHDEKEVASDEVQSEGVKASYKFGQG